MSKVIFSKMAKRAKIYITFSSWPGWGWMPEARRTLEEAEQDLHDAASQGVCEAVSGPHKVEIILQSEDPQHFKDKLNRRLYDKTLRLKK